MLVKVKNLKNNYFDSPKDFPSWKAFWEAKKGRLIGKCANEACEEKALLGVHVNKVLGSNEQYILPLCNYCNKIEEEFTVDSLNLVRVIQD